MPIRDELRLKFHCALLAKVLLEEMVDVGSAKTWDSGDILVVLEFYNIRNTCLCDKCCLSRLLIWTLLRNGGQIPHRGLL